MAGAPNRATVRFTDVADSGTFRLLTTNRRRRSSGLRSNADHDRPYRYHQPQPTCPPHLVVAPQALLETAMIRSRSALCLSSGSHTGCIPSPVEALVATSTSTLVPSCFSRLLTTAAGQGATHRLRSAASSTTRYSSSQRCIRRNKSTTAIDFTQSSSSPTSIGSLSPDASTAPAGSVVLPVPTPTPQALRTLFVASAIPMVGFGFMVRAVLLRLV